MANPFLVLGGIAISVVTAAFGVLAVPGWIASAQDASAANDVSQVALAQEAVLSETGAYAPSLGAIATAGTANATTDSENTVATAVDTTGEHAITVARSASGRYFARLGGHSKIGSGTTVATALAAAGTTVTGGYTAEGVKVPTIEKVIARNYVIDPLGTSLDSFGTFREHSVLSLITSFPGDVPTAIRSTRLMDGATRHLNVRTGSATPLGEDLRFTATLRLSEPMHISFSLRTEVGEPGTEAADDVSVSLPAGISAVDFVFTGSGHMEAGATTGVSIKGSSGAIGATVDATLIGLTKASAGVGFFYGGSGTVQGMEARWAGEPGKSQSVLVR